MNVEKEKLEEIAKEKVKKVAKKVNDDEISKGEVKPLVECRVLFISVLDKILLILLGLSFIGSTYFNLAFFKSSGTFQTNFNNFWEIVGSEIVIIIIYAIIYLFVNWLYKCAVKTMLCVTDKEVYKVTYFPFFKKETSIPLNKITAVSCHKFFWIFRGVVVHQYMSVPKVFLTWNAQEFKDKVVELTTKEDKKVENSAEEKNLIPKDKLKYLLYAGIALGAIIILLGVISFVGSLFSPANKIPGTYSYKYDQIVLYKEGTCDIPVSSKNCSWTYNNDTKKVKVEYVYEGNYYDWDETMYLDYDKDNASLLYKGDTYIKTN